MTIIPTNNRNYALGERTSFDSKCHGKRNLGIGKWKSRFKFHYGQFPIAVKNGAGPYFIFKMRQDKQTNSTNCIGPPKMKNGFFSTCNGKTKFTRGETLCISLYNSRGYMKANISNRLLHFVTETVIKMKYWTIRGLVSLCTAGASSNPYSRWKSWKI